MFYLPRLCFQSDQSPHSIEETLCPHSVELILSSEFHFIHKLGFVQKKKWNNLAKSLWASISFLANNFFSVIIQKITKGKAVSKLLKEKSSNKILLIFPSPAFVLLRMLTSKMIRRDSSHLDWIPHIFNPLKMELWLYKHVLRSINFLWPNSLLFQ